MLRTAFLRLGPPRIRLPLLLHVLGGRVSSLRAVLTVTPFYLKRVYAIPHSGEFMSQE